MRPSPEADPRSAAVAAVQRQSGECIRRLLAARGRLAGVTVDHPLRTLREGRFPG